MPKVNVSIERHKFNTRVQRENETFDSFLNDLRRISADCDFGALRDDMIRDRIVCAIIDKRVKDRLLRESDLKLQKAIDICKAAEETSSNISSLLKKAAQGETSGSVSVITKKNYGRSGNKAEFKNQGRREAAPQAIHQRAASTSQAAHQKAASGHTKPRTDRNWERGAGASFVRTCSRCGRQHQRGSCPAYGKQCAKCSRYNHFANQCFFNKSNQNVNTISQNNRNHENTVQTIDYVLDTVVNENDSPTLNWFEDIKIVECNKTVKFKLDSGAQVNVIPKYIFDKLGISKIDKTDTSISNYAGQPLPVLGSCNLKVIIKNKDYNLIFLVVETKNNAAPIIGLPSIQHLNLISRREVSEINKTKNNDTFNISDYDNVFKGLGLIKIEPCDFKLKENYEPVTMPCRKVAFQLINPLKKELDRMLKDQIITKVDEPTEFVHPIVIVKKKENDQIRICLDPKHLNDALIREYYSLPTFEDLTSEMAGSKVFSVLDANKGFYQIKLTEKASFLTTFATPLGRFRFLRLPFGVKVAPEIFQKVFNQIFGDIDGVKIYIDDIIIFAKDVKTHNEIINKVMQRALETGVKFNKSKCKFLVKEIKYVGHVFSEDGIKLDEDKIKAIKQIPTPDNKDKLRKFLGMITYVAKFIPNLSKLSANLRQLLKKDIVWQWEDVHDKEFNNLKRQLSNSPVLQYYDRNQPIVLSVDSSKNGLGAVILQNGAPVAYASKSLTETQCNYAQIEKETLAILFGCQRFHQYLFGTRFLVETDHKPLESIFNKSLDKVPLRIQRLLLSLQNYDFSVKYTPGKYLYFADTLSRTGYDDKMFIINETESNVQIDMINFFSVSTKRFEEIKIETQKDCELQELLNLIKNGWPDSKKQLKENIKPYWKDRDDLVEMKGIIFKCNRMVIPKSLRNDIINKLHYTHLGLEKTLCKAQELVYWPYMNKEITDKILNCQICLRFKNSLQKESLINRQLPTRPWQIIASDLFEYKGIQYLLVVDYFSKFPEVCILHEGTTSGIIIQNMKYIFARHGKPDLIYTDMGPQYSSSEFQQFLEDWKISMQTSTPHYAQSNGFIERHVQTIKQLIKKTIADKKDIFLALLEYRNTPIDRKTPSPAELLFGRKLKGLIPMSEEILKPKFDINTQVKALQQKQSNQKFYYDKHAKDLQRLSVNDPVMMQDSRTGEWNPGMIIGIDQNRPRSYLVKLNKNNKTYIRNRRYLRKIENNFVTDDDFYNMLNQLVPENDISYNQNDNVKNQEPKNVEKGVVVEDKSKCKDSLGETLKFSRSGRCIRKPKCFDNFYCY